MKATMKTFKSWIDEKVAAYKKAAAEKKNRAIARESERAVQVREFDGSVYICLNDIPVIKGEYVSGDIVSAVKCVRQAWIQWKEKGTSHGAAGD